MKQKEILYCDRDYLSDDCTNVATYFLKYSLYNLDNYAKCCYSCYNILKKFYPQHEDISRQEYLKIISKK